MLKRTLVGIVLMMLGSCEAFALAASDAPPNHKTDSNKSSTLDDIGRGLKSAAKNIGDEIPKIGPAVMDTIDNVTGKKQDKSSKKGTVPPPAKDQSKR
jgi:hypothetical protein